MSFVDSAEKRQFIKTEKYKEIKWAASEYIFKVTRHLHRSPHSITEIIPVSLVLDIRIKLSCFGRFMKNFNEDQIHNFFWNENNLGIEMYNYMNFNEIEKTRWTFHNDFTDDLLELLKKGVQTCECLDYDFLYSNLRTLRLNNGPINKVDSLTKFTKMEVLVLAANWIKTLHGRNLPPKLQYLECFCNELKTVKGICYKNGPQRLKYLGLARNLLNESSCLNLLAESGTFQELRVLDISNNNIVSLNAVLEELSPLQQLTALALEGNPCYVCQTYKENVLIVLPKLLYLDGTEILPEDRPTYCDLYMRNLSKKATFICTCYRITGLPPPPKTKATQTYYIEIDLPLLEPIKIPGDVLMVNKSTDVHIFTSSTKLKQRGSASKSLLNINKTGKKTTKGEDKPKKEKSKAKPPEKLAAVDGTGLYALPNEVDMVENEYITFRTEEKAWSKIMKFKEPTLTVDVEYEDFNLLRDTFRSRVRVKIIYVQRMKEKTKGQGKVPKTPHNSKPSSPTSSSTTSTVKKTSVTQMRDITLKRSTLATFYCDLHPVNWSDHYLDFIWADHPSFGNTAKFVEGTLKPEIYEEKASASSGKKSPVFKMSTIQKNPIPKFLTCNMGFGLYRYVLEPHLSK